MTEILLKDGFITDESEIGGNGYSRQSNGLANIL